MIPNGINRLKELREGMLNQVQEYLAELEHVYDELRAEATEFRDKLMDSDQPELIAPEKKVPSNIEILEKFGKPKRQIIVEIINELEAISVTAVIERLRKFYTEEQIADKYVRAVIHKLASEENSPLRRVREGTGNTPNEYEKIRPVE